MTRAWPLLLLAACGVEHPPFATLPLRATLLADPREIAALPPEERATLRARFERELLAPTTELMPTDARGLDAVTWHDERHEDAVLGVAVGEHGVAHDRTEYDPDARGHVELPAVDDASPEVAALEARALAGPAAALLERVMAMNRLSKLSRLEHAPAAYVIDGDTLQVNEAWLMVMASYASSRIVSASVHALTSANLQSVSECASDLTAQCASCTMNATCDSAPVITDYASGAAECAAVALGNGAAQNACIALILSRPEALECVRRNDATCATGDPKTNAFAAKIRASSFCSKIVDGCAANADYVVPISCDVCTNASRSCTNACSNACQVNCTNPSISTSGCRGPSLSCSSCGSRVCNATPLRDDYAPLWTWVWGLAPILYLVRRSRR